MRFALVKPHGFPAFLHGKTAVFPTPFPDFQSITGTPSKGRQKGEVQKYSTPSGKACYLSRGEFIS